jgi:hypothetical protein
MRYLKSDKMYCFSPPVMLATFIIEIACVAYVIFRYHMNAVSRLTVGILMGLAIFQLAEYNVCEGAWGISSLDWARVGYVAITLLPPLGLHLATKLAGESRPGLVGAAYASAAVFSYIFLFVGHGMQSQLCLGNYVIFTIAPWATIPYAMYYYGWLMVGVGYMLKAARAMKEVSKQKALRGLMLGYLAFIVPTTAANVIDPNTISGIPSIMCGFAVILAITLTTVVLPNYFKQTDSSFAFSGLMSSLKTRFRG